MSKNTLNIHNLPILSIPEASTFRYTKNMSENDLKQRVSAAVQEFESQNNVLKISLFGSFLEDTTSAQDVDLLIELKNPVGYFELVRMEKKLQEKIGLPVDLVEPAALSRHFRDNTIKQARTVYQTTHEISS